MTPSFNLVDEPWIPCLFAHGDTDELCLYDALARAHEIREIFDSSPLVVTTLHRLLLAILHRNFGPESLTDWKKLWQRGHWDEATLRGYFNQWRHRFDLFHPERPFYQVPEMKNDEEQPIQKHPVHLLALEASAGNNPTLFDHSFSTAPATFTPARAARYLVACQAFALGGGVSQPENFTHAPLVRGYSILVLGNTLFETLALNMHGYTKERPIAWQGKDDPPVWEQEPQPQPSKGSVKPKGYLDYLTWQSRRIYLVPEPRPGLVKHCQILQNRRLADDFYQDPFMAYKKDEKRGILPRKIDPEKALWRDCQALFELPGADSAFLRPEIFNWVARSIESSRNLCFALGGLGADRAKVFLWRQERLPLPLTYLENVDLLGRLKGALSLAEEVSRTLKNHLRDVAKGILDPATDLHKARKPDSKAQRQAVDNLLKTWAPDRLYFSQLEAPFRRLLVELPNDRQKDEDGDLEYGGKELPQWGQVLQRAASKSFETISAGLGGSPRALKAVAQVEDRFRAALYQEIRKLSPGGKHEAEE
ncbi:MAG: type I-E CRISPR-associated protein Cse1/CasA [Deltaproteobacteria bacterium]|nr:type I-E CRISPR-associated protein Cse1/CasA [Deltaproteobacteria bacterium]